jgi:hypothetical protein
MLGAVLAEKWPHFTPWGCYCWECDWCRMTKHCRGCHTLIWNQQCLKMLNPCRDGLNRHTEIMSEVSAKLCCLAHRVIFVIMTLVSLRLEKANRMWQCTQWKLDCVGPTEKLHSGANCLTLNLLWDKVFFSSTMNLWTDCQQGSKEVLFNWWYVLVMICWVGWWYAKSSGNYHFFHNSILKMWIINKLF